MILPQPQDAIHKAWLYRVLIHIYDDVFLASALNFKGGTCAAMLGILNRFSVDLDFDFILPEKEMPKTRESLENIFKQLGLEIKDQSRNVPQYFLRYQAKENIRNTLKIDITTDPPKANVYQKTRLTEIDRIVTTQTKETMFANKLVALIDRFEKNNSIAGRDIYDIHYFYLQGFRYEKEVILERRKTDLKTFFKELVKFVENKITDTIINQDLNFLLPTKEFSKIRKTLKQEVLMFLKDELKRLG